MPRPSLWVMGIMGCSSLAFAADGGTSELPRALPQQVGAPPPQAVPFFPPESFTLSGSGCPEGSYHARVADNGSLQIDFTQMAAWKDRSAACEIVISVPDEEGVSYELTHHWSAYRWQDYQGASGEYQVTATWKGM